MHAVHGFVGAFVSEVSFDNHENVVGSVHEVSHRRFAKVGDVGKENSELGVVGELIVRAVFA